MSHRRIRIPVTRATLLDEFIRKCLVIDVTRSSQARRSGSGTGVSTLFVEPVPPWENGDIESFNRSLRDERLNGAIFKTLLEANVLIPRRLC